MNIIKMGIMGLVVFVAANLNASSGFNAQAINGQTVCTSDKHCKSGQVCCRSKNRLQPGYCAANMNECKKRF